MGVPLTGNFVGEFLILLGSFWLSHCIILLSSFGMILTLIYCLFFFNRIFFGPVQDLFIKFYSDCNRLEFFVLIFFVFSIIIFGLFPNLFLDYMCLFFLKSHLYWVC